MWPLRKFNVDSRSSRVQGHLIRIGFGGVYGGNNIANSSEFEILLRNPRNTQALCEQLPRFGVLRHLQEYGCTQGFAGLFTRGIGFRVTSLECSGWVVRFRAQG